MDQHCTGNLRRLFPTETFLCAQGQYCISNFIVKCSLRRIWTTTCKNIPKKERLFINHGPTLHRQFHCAIFVHIDHDNLVDYFPMYCCSWAVDQHCTCKQFFCETLPNVDQDNFIQVIFLQKHVCALCANIGQVIFFCTMLSQTYLDNIDETIFLCNVVRLWSIQHCIGYLLHKSCLLAIGQHYTGKSLVQCCPRGSRQQCTGKNLVQ